MLPKWRKRPLWSTFRQLPQDLRHKQLGINRVIFVPKKKKRARPPVCSRIPQSIKTLATFLECPRWWMRAIVAEFKLFWLKMFLGGCWFESFIQGYLQLGYSCINLVTAWVELAIQIGDRFFSQSVMHKKKKNSKRGLVFFTDVFFFLSIYPVF